MKFEQTVWPIKRLVAEHNADKLNLNPPYQRNAVWTAKAQQRLLQSILSGKAIPNFFLLQKEDKSFEMIDGQQRARTILGYERNMLVDHENLTFEERLAKSSNRKDARTAFLEYPVSITLVTALDDNESVEDYYALLNSSGLRLNRPELKKAEYFTTNFLRLVQELSSDERLQNLKLFSASSSARMNDVDFVSELVSLLRFGISDKKEKVDQLYEDDVTMGEFRALKSTFSKMLDIFQHFNHATPLIRTRYKQKNDFYSLFYFFYTVRDIKQEALDIFYRVLVKIGPYIRPSQEECEPLKEYAYHCVTQSNSKASRQARHDILVNILLNREITPNPTQKALLRFFDLSPKNIVRVDPFFTLDPGAIRDPHNHEFDFEEDEI